MELPTFIVAVCVCLTSPELWSFLESRHGFHMYICICSIQSTEPSIHLGHVGNTSQGSN